MKPFTVDRHSGDNLFSKDYCRIYGFWRLNQQPDWQTQEKGVVIAAEVKSELNVWDVKRYLNSLDQFFLFFDEYRGRDLIGAVCRTDPSRVVRPDSGGIRLSRGIQEFAEKQGLYVLAPSGETMIILNKPGFKPRIWR